MDKQKILELKKQVEMSPKLFGMEITRNGLKEKIMSNLDYSQCEENQADFKVRVFLLPYTVDEHIGGSILFIRKKSLFDKLTKGLGEWKIINDEGNMGSFDDKNWLVEFNSKIIFPILMENIKNPKTGKRYKFEDLFRDYYFSLKV